MPAPLLIASKLIAGGRGLAPAIVRRAAVVELDWDTRQKSRFDAVDSHGRTLGVFLARGRIVRGGDVLVAEDGSLVRVKARDQPILAVTARGGDGSALALLRAAYHLGNRHVPLELRADRLQLEPDPVLAELLRRMGLGVEASEGPFEPEAGAYDTASSKHGRGHGPAHGPAHGHEGHEGHAKHDGHEHGHDHPEHHDGGHDHDHSHGHGTDR